MGVEQALAPDAAQDQAGDQPVPQDAATAPAASGPGRRAGSRRRG
jgi:hypothetical protein